MSRMRFGLRMGWQRGAVNGPLSTDFKNEFNGLGDNLVRNNPASGRRVLSTDY
jgi:hypothetical protein